MNAVFMGTPEFAVPCLEAMLAQGHQVKAVVTQPDRPKGRGKQLAMSPVKEAALKSGIEVFQPENVKSPEFVEKLREMAPDVIVVVAFGQILSKDILDIPKYGCINVHASLLPKYRGAAPINWVIINGENETGITTMLMDEGLDTGDMLIKESLQIGENETASELHDRLSKLGAAVLGNTLAKLEEGSLTREKQSDAESSYAPIMKKTLGEIAWSKSAREIFNLVRGTFPWPGAFTTLDGMVMKVLRCRFESESQEEASAGEILDVSKTGIRVKAAAGVLVIEEIQMPGKKKMSVEEYLRGNSIQKGAILGA
ncbi:methionyl-tRNA formyltransferase Fmt [Peptoclostridium acidaminophilum DSM 3953]|uniref:Methionyl-tRNA formyltransferase n=1 Tax=Peptoclostridium acidaminophilum DSM 3953 TaxID=1286171 RepID=W8TG16_PEPAC|nr:methionyl-tRNA formyltransferase [Peptoclostridium acidaminophilum]AHM56768.1 methionyl-tRNA formyltransferase Fmt [Peptoclostridium acidaminophilum DSM 3953]